MSKELVISATPHETRVAILEDGHLCEIYIEREKEFALVGSIYKGRVTRVLPGMQSAVAQAETQLEATQAQATSLQISGRVASSERTKPCQMSRFNPIREFASRICSW